MIPPEQGTIHGKTHLYPVRVYYEDTDAGGVVYHARYLHFAERARTEFLRCVGFPHDQLMKNHDAVLVVRHIEADYLKPARLDEALLVETEFVNIGGASIKMSQSIHLMQNKGLKEPISRILLRLVCVNGNARPERLPEAFRQAIEKFI